MPTGVCPTKQITIKRKIKIRETLGRIDGQNWKHYEIVERI